MKDSNTLLKIRKALQRKKPNFIAQDTHKRKEVRKRWKKPTGVHSKMREHRKGHPKVVSKGWRSPKKIRGYHPTGLKICYVRNVSDLSPLNNKADAIMISSQVGTKKKIEIIEAAKKKNITVLNYRDVDGFVNNVKNRLQKAKEEKAKLVQEKKEMESKKKIKEEDKATLAGKIQSEDERKEQEKKEKDKILTKKQ